MFAALVRRVRGLGHRLLHATSRRLLAATTPSTTRLVVDTLADLPRSKGELIAENALLRQQLLVLLASRVRAWRQALLIVQPETVLRWHRQGFRLFWRWKSKVTQPTAPPR